MNATTLPSFARRLQRHRVFISRVISVALVAYLFGYERIDIFPLSSAMGLFGMVVILLGIGVRTLSAGMLHKNETLATEGIYAVVRNPLYLGSLLMLLGINIVVADALMLGASLALFAIIYAPTILREEQGLAKVYGEKWEQFRRTTPRLFPNLLRLGSLRQSAWHFEQWRKNHEHNTILAATGLLLLLHLYQQYFAIG